MTTAETLEQHKIRARAWFEALRDDICAALETLEDTLPAEGRSHNSPPAVSCARCGNAPIIRDIPAVAARRR